ncbi:MAG: LacI family DNA-binding transcriptional regulator, partial [Clostridia bacterium]|nr:LacI family DNA-binding transcriptional regulator [Clostridia bacterium]
MPQEVTIKDIARAAEVSVATVSRVINDNYPVSQEVRERVTRVMAELHYRPNAIAQSLRSNKSNMAGLIVADLSNQYFMNAVKGIEKVLMAKGYHLVVASSDGRPEKERQLIQAMISKRLDALCIASVDQEGESIRQAISSGTPIVLIDRVLNDVDTSQVCWNDAEAARTLTRLLLEHGHREIAIINVTLTHSVGRDRLAAFRGVMRDAGITLPKSFISPSNFSAEEAQKYVLKVMSGKRRPTALLCANNVMAEGALRALGELRLRLYEDVSLVTVGTPDWNNYMTP